MAWAGTWQAKSSSEAQFETQFATGASFKKLEISNIGLLHSTALFALSAQMLVIALLCAISCLSLLSPKLSKVSHVCVLANLFS